MGHRARVAPGERVGRERDDAGARGIGATDRRAASSWRSRGWRRSSGPEGALTALFVAATLAAFPRDARRGDARLLALAAVAAVVALPLLLWALTGSARSNTAVAKLLPGNPYYVGPALIGGASRRTCARS